MTTTVKPVAKKSSSAKKQAKNVTAEIVKQVSTYQDEIPLDLIDVSAQPRKIFDQNDLKELADSIKAKGLLQNVLLRRRGERYELLVGERRLRAHKIVNLPTIRATIGENFYESKIPQDAVQFIAERENVNYLAKDAEARIQLTRERPDYKRFLLLAEQFQREVGEADQTQLKEMKTPVFFD